MPLVTKGFNMINITSPEKIEPQENTSFFNHPVFELLFRSHFLLASIASIISLFIWLNFYFHGSVINLTGLPPIVWHTHEMIFTFASTVAVGFIMTAVQTWTGQKSITGMKALILILLWIVCHSLFWMNTEVSVWIATILKTLWWVLIIAAYTRLVLVSKNKRNYLFIPLLSAIAIMNISVLLLALNERTYNALHLSKTAVLLFTLLISILGGRVIPFFTANGTRTEQVKPVLWLDYSILAFSLLGILLFALSGLTKLSISPAFIMVTVGTLHLIRSARWCNKTLFFVPLLWSLHAAYCFMALGLILMGLSYFQLPLPLSLSQGIHLITLGAVGLMILSMMSRVSLGHTGRLLQPNKAIIFAFFMLVIATIIRALLPSFGYLTLALCLSAVLWVVSFTIFLVIYFPVLTKARRTTL